MFIELVSLFPALKGLQIFGIQLVLIYTSLQFGEFVVSRVHTPFVDYAGHSFRLLCFATICGCVSREPPPPPSVRSSRVNRTSDVVRLSLYVGKRAQNVRFTFCIGSYSLPPPPNTNISVFAAYCKIHLKIPKCR